MYMYIYHCDRVDSTMNMAHKDVYTGSFLANHDIEETIVRHVKREIQGLSQARVNVINRDDDEYDFTHQYRGMAVVISIKTFDPSLNCHNRNYADIDLDLYDETFSKLGFVVLKFIDLTAEQIHEVLKTASSPALDFFNRQADCFVCVLASHGKEMEDMIVQTKDVTTKIYTQVIFGTNDVIKMTDIMALFDDSSFTCFRGKPKLFFIEACRTRPGTPSALKYDVGVDVSIKMSEEQIQNNPNLQHPETSVPDNVKSKESGDTPSNAENDNGQASSSSTSGDQEDIHYDALEESPTEFMTKMTNWIKDMFPCLKMVFSGSEHAILNATPIPCPNDTLIMYSTTSGKVSFGADSIGALMINILKKVTDMYSDWAAKNIVCQIDYLELLTIAMKMAALLQVPTKDPEHSTSIIALAMEHRLTKDIVFRTKYI